MRKFFKVYDKYYKTDIGLVGVGVNRNERQAGLSFYVLGGMVQ